MRRKLLVAALCFSAITSYAQKKMSDFTFEGKKINNDNIGILADLSLSTSSSFVKTGEGYSHTAKGALSTVPRIGLFIQKGLGPRFSIRGSFAFGFSAFAYNYAAAFDSMRADQSPTNTHKYSNYTRVKHNVGFVQPQIDIGYLFGPYKKVFFLEARGGVGLLCYLSKSDTSTRMAKGTVKYPDGVSTLSYYSKERAFYGKPNVWGSLVADIYIGIRWAETTSDFLNQSSIGIQATLPVSNSNAGYSEIEYREGGSFGYLLGREKVEMGLMSFGIRFSYRFF